MACSVLAGGVAREVNSGLADQPREVGCWRAVNRTSEIPDSYQHGHAAKITSRAETVIPVFLVTPRRHQSAD